MDKFLFLNFLLFSNCCIAGTIMTKSEILTKSTQCFKFPRDQGCEKLIFQMEQMQLAEFEKNRFKCQSSLLGLQSELIEAYFLKNFSKERISFMIPYVIKNC